MCANTPVVKQLYHGFAESDPHAILAALAPDFVGHVSAGMPCGVGGRHEGAARMLTSVWAVVAGEYDISPVPDAIRTADDDTVVVHGYYSGTHRPSAKPVRAEFVHLIRLRDARIVELRQITDTASWLVDG